MGHPNNVGTQSGSINNQVSRVASTPTPANKIAKRGRILPSWEESSVVNPIVQKKVFETESLKRILERQAEALFSMTSKSALVSVYLVTS